MLWGRWSQKVAMRPVGRATDRGTEETGSMKPHGWKAAWLVSSQRRAGDGVQLGPDLQGYAGHVWSLAPLQGGRAKARCTAHSPLPLGAEAVCGLGAPHAPLSQPASTGLSSRTHRESRVTTVHVLSGLSKELQGKYFELGHGLVPQTRRQGPWGRR